MMWRRRRTVASLTPAADVLTVMVRILERAGAMTDEFEGVGQRRERGSVAEAFCLGYVSALRELANEIRSGVFLDAPDPVSVELETHA